MLEKEQILVIDDDIKLCALIKEYLESMGYQVHIANRGIEGLELLSSNQFHAILLDVMLPNMDGFEVLKRIRATSDTPVLMFTSRGDEMDRIVGLEIGADDYVPKTFSTRELLARLRAVIRRSTKSAESQKHTAATLYFGDLVINQDAHEVELEGDIIELSPIEYSLLVLLAQSAGKILSRDQLLDATAGRNYDSFDRSIDMHISSLRKKLRDNPRSPHFIKTVRNSGYLFIQPEEGANS